MANNFISEAHKLQKSNNQRPSARWGQMHTIRSSLEQFYRTFVGKRSMRCVFSMKGTSARDSRKVFSTILRHTKSGSYNPTDDTEFSWNKDPDLDILIPCRLNNPDNTIEYNGVNIKTDTYDLDKKATDYDGLKADFEPIHEFWSPYNMMEFEDLSWNLNRHKVLPYGISATSMQNKFTLGNPKGTGLDTALNDYKGLPGTGFSFVKSKDQSGPIYDEHLSDKLTVSPVLVDLAHDHRDYQSNMRKTCIYFNAQTAGAYELSTPKDAIGKYVAQVSNGVCYYTFNNTGDSKILVDILVHKIKDGCGFGPCNEAVIGGEEGQSTAKRITDRIIEQYAAGWMERRSRNKGDYYMYETSNKKYEPLDIVFNPKVKFMPTSCRTLKYAADDVNVGAHDVAPLNNGGKLDTDMELARQQRFQYQTVQTPPFVEIKREQIVVLPGKRKTFALRLPSKSYDPTKPVYDPQVFLNELGYHVMFGITGQRSRTIVAGRG